MGECGESGIGVGGSGEGGDRIQGEKEKLL